MDSQPYPLADPIPDRALDFKLQHFAASPAPHIAVGSAHVCAELDRYDIAVVLRAVYEWGGYRDTNSLDAIATAKRERK
jgi:hypothetical protein